VNQKGPVLVTGIKPTGRVHLGNYLGMIRPALELAGTHEAYVFIADSHAMTTESDPVALSRQSRELAAGLLALGLDPGGTVLYRQSEVGTVFELGWILACSAPKGLLNRAHAYKAAVEANRSAGRPADEGVNAGLFTYPVLMAADILGMGGTLVPVGADQAQHLEITRDLAVAFNRDYGRTFAVAEAVIDEAVAVIPGTDGRKMSKSYDNVIPIFGDPPEMAKLVRGIVTDSRCPEEPKDPGSCRLFALYRHLAEPEAVASLAETYLSGGIGYGEVKQLLIEVLQQRFGPARLRYLDLLEGSGELEAVLADGAEKARSRAQEIFSRVRQARGLAA